MKALQGIAIVLQNQKYLFLFFATAALFCIIYVFEWNLILPRGMYVRSDLWTAANVFFLAVISILSGLAITMGIFNLRLNMPAFKKGYGYLAVFPAFLASACPTCAPFLLSFTSTSFAIGLALAEFGTFIKLASIAILAITIAHASYNIGVCRTKPKNKK